MSRTQAWSLVATAVCLVGAALWHLGRQSEIEGEPLAVALASDFTATYALEYKVRGSGRVDLPGAKAKSQLGEVDLAVKGLLSLARVQKEGEDQLLDFFLQIESMTGMLRLRSTQGRLRLAPWGEILDFELIEEDQRTLAPFLGDVFSLMSTDLRGAHDGGWQAVEQSFAGATPVGWRLERSERGRLDFEKTYLPAVDGAMQVSGGGSVSFGLGAYLQKVKVERSRVTKPGGLFAGNDHTTLLLEIAPAAKGLKAPIRANNAMPLVRETLRGDAHAAFLLDQMAESTLGGASLLELQTTLEQIDGKDLQASTLLYQKIQAQMRLHPATLDQWLRFLLDYDYGDLRCSHVASALTADGAPAAQAVLVRAISGALDAEKREALVPHLSLVEQPTMESESFLRELAEQDASARVRGGARLALGTIAHQVRHSARERSEAILGEWRERLAASKDPAERDQALRVLGNIGLPELLPTLVPLLESKDEQLQEKAIRAMRLIDDDRAIEILIPVLEAESKPALQLAAARSLAHGPARPELLAAYERYLLQGGRNASVAAIILGHLGTLGQSAPTAVQLLERFAEVCGLEDLCAQARRVLDTLSASPKPD